MYDDVLIAVDGSDEAARAARWGVHLARRVGARVGVLHVVERDALRLTRDDDEAERLRERGRALLADVTAAVDRPGEGEVGVAVETLLREGRPARVVGEVAAERDADLIVVGRQGVTGLGRRLLGGVTERLCHLSEVPVLVVPGDAPVPVPDPDADDDDDEGDAGLGRVLVPTDGSDDAGTAASHGARLARLGDADLHVLHVVDLQAAGGVFNAGGLETAFVERLESEGRAVVERVADDVATFAPDVDVTTAVETTSSFEGVAAGVREYVADAGIDLVVIGSHGRSAVGRQLAGSVASGVLRTVDVPVLVVRRGT